jgi:asparagine synthetase B (glutamine-hydrolysing)
MQQSIETRVPFLDPDVVALTINLPIEARVLPERKGVLRDLAARVLPDEIARRPKVGFGFDIDRYVEPALRPGFLAEGALREALGASAADWDERVATMRGQRRMLALSAEILVRVMVHGASPEAVERELWT